MARKTRVTTSVSTLVQQMDSMVRIAKVAQRKDLLATFKPLLADVQKLEAEYKRLRNEIDPFVKLLLTADTEIDETAEVAAE